MLLAAIFIGLGFLSGWSKMNINDIETSGNKVADTDSMKEVVWQEIGGHYLWLYPKTNFLFYPKKGIENKLREKFKVLKDISINVTDSKILQVSVTERTPSYLWCGADLPGADAVIDQGGCYFMDDSGYIFSSAPYFSGDVYFKFFGQFQNKDEAVGSYFLPDIFDNIISFIDAVKEMGLKPASLVAKDNQNLELYLSALGRSPTGEANTPPPNAPKIIFKRNFELGKTVENLQTALATDPLATDFKKKYSSLVYIDLGFGNKVYFKFR